MVDNTISITTGKKRLSGWQEVSIRVSCESIPSYFELAVTERYPGQLATAVIKPGDTCTVDIGPDRVITGYVDRYEPAMGPRQHSVKIVGRGVTCDLVDNSVTPDLLGEGMQVLTSSLVALAKRLCDPLGITVVSRTGNDVPVSLPGGAPLQFNAVLTETPYEVIERVARYAGVMLYESTRGELVIANVAGEKRMASGFAQAVNVQRASATLSVDERYGTYLPTLMSTNFFGQEGVGGKSFKPAEDAYVKSLVRHDGKPRIRQLIVVSEQFQFGDSFAEKRAQWEAGRRWGRSQSTKMVIDNWRDKAGDLWRPNAVANVYLPALKVTQADGWVIGDVEFSVDMQSGMTARISMMPKEAFQPAPELLVPFLWDPTNPSPKAIGPDDKIPANSPRQPPT